MTSISKTTGIALICFVVGIWVGLGVLGYRVRALESKQAFIEAQCKAAAR